MAVVNNWRLWTALGFLNPEVVSRLLGANKAAQKARALVMHDQLLLGYPRERTPHAENFRAEDQCLNKSA